MSTILSTPPAQLDTERADLLTEQKNLQALRRQWERGEVIELYITRPGYPAGSVSVISTCDGPDAHLISTPLNALIEQNTYHLLMLDIALTSLP